jgi:hypothetical protein
LYIPSGVTRQKKNKKKKIPEARGAPLFCSVHLSVCGLLLLLVVASSYSTANDCNFRTHPGSQPNNKKEKKGMGHQWAAGVLKFLKTIKSFKTCSKNK